MNKLSTKNFILAMAVASLLAWIVIYGISTNNNAIDDDINEILRSAPPSAGGASKEARSKFLQEKAKFQQQKKLLQAARALKQSENSRDAKKQFKEQKRKFLEAHKKFMAAKGAYKKAKRNALAAASKSTQTQETLQAKWKAAQKSQETQKSPEPEAAKSSVKATSVVKVTDGNSTSFTQASLQTLTLNETEQAAELIEVKTAPLSSTAVSSSPTVISGSQFTLLPQDVYGWSVIKPQNDSRLIFVSSSTGDDLKAKPYTTDEVTDPYLPSKDVIAFETIGKAMGFLRDGYPDWILLKKGDEWHIGGAMSFGSGRSPSAPLVIASYGSSSERPVVNTGTESGIKLTKGRSYIAVMGIEFYANHRNPDSSSFAGWDNVGTPIGLSSVTGDTAVDLIHLENNVFNYYGINVKFDGWSKHENIILRRNQFLNAYSTGGHSQGVFTNRASLLIEDNLFDHNGWYQQNYEKLNSKSKGQATYFNHNAYLANATDTVIQNNIFTRSSSIGVKLTANSDKSTGVNSVMAKNIKIKNNLFVEGEIGISAGGNTDFNNGYRWKDIDISDNVMLHIGNTQPTRRTLAFHIDANDWDGGSITGNHLLYNDNSDIVKTVYGIQVSGLSRNIDVSNNVLQGIGGKSGSMIYAAENESIHNVNFNNNDIDTDLTQKGARNDLISYFNLSKSTAGNGVEKLVERAKTQMKGNWNNSYLAREINKHLMR